MILPSEGSGRSSTKAYETAYYLCDNGKYLLGLDPKYFESARKLHLSLLDGADTPAAKAIKAYFMQSIPSIPSGSDEKVDPQATYVFSYNGKRIDYDYGDEQIILSWKNVPKRSGERTRCLVTGGFDEVINKHNKINLKGVTMGKQALISMNEQASFRSYNDIPDDPPARIGQYAAFAYASALDALLMDEKHHMLIGGDTLVFWAEKGGETEEELFINVFEPPESDGDFELGATIMKIAKGYMVVDPALTCKFYLLCLSPNAARISIRFFHQCNFGNLIRSIMEHYSRLEIARGERTHYFIPPKLILSETTIKNTAKDAMPILGGQLLKSILTNTDYPLTLYNAIITRIRAGEPITQTKAAVIKAILIKNEIFKEREETTVSLNEESNNKPYVLGRLFSVLERLQEKANGTATIRSRYFATACVNPASVFPTLLRLSFYHSAKLDNPVYFEKQKTDLLDKLDDETHFPAYLGLNEQGLFILGYYHQTQKNFFTKKDKMEETSDEG